jgi:hypothetical protein
MTKNNASIGTDIVERIKEVYPQVNLIWLLTGKGDMFIKEDVPKTRSAHEIKAFIDKKLKEEYSEERKALLEEILKEIENVSNSKS